MVILPLDIHHSGRGSLGVAALIWRPHWNGLPLKFRFAHRRDIIGGVFPAQFRIGDTLKTGQSHIIAQLISSLFLNPILRCAAGKQTFDHKL